METKKMTPSQWLAVLDNPLQRDTAAHAKRAVNKHLKTPSETHKRVSAALLPGGKLVKLDGHTRALLWSDQRLAAPPCVFVDIYPVKSMDEAKELYKQFDNASATETARDKLSGAYRNAGLDIQSGLLLQGAVTSAIGYLVPRGTQIYAAVINWRSELQELDSLMIQDRQNAGMILGALAMLRKRKSRAVDFISKVAMDAGAKTGKGSDGVDAICRYALDRKGRLAGEPAIRDMAEKFISAGEGYLAGRLYQQAPKRTNLTSYLDK